MCDHVEALNSVPSLVSRSGIKPALAGKEKNALAQVFDDVQASGNEEMDLNKAVNPGELFDNGSMYSSRVHFVML